MKLQSSSNSIGGSARLLTSQIQTILQNFARALLFYVFEPDPAVLSSARLDSNIAIAVPILIHPLKRPKKK
jgi:hypothetical protein